MSTKPDSKKIRYAVVALGYIDQIAVLPAFKHAQKNSELVAVVSDDAKKKNVLTKKYKIPFAYSYDEYEDCLESGQIDAVYIGLPNHMHREYTLRALNKGIHVLCEKPMALSTADCQSMIDAAHKNNAKLMIAYRLHFQKANMEAVQIAHSGKLGDLRFFNSTFSMNVRPGNIRTQKATGGGAINDIGIYCINAARYLFRDEPCSVAAILESNQDPRFRTVEEMAGTVLQFPKNRLATFMCSFNGPDIATYVIAGTKGFVHLESSYEYSEPMKMTVTINGKSKVKQYAKQDQFAPELLYFSDCILKNKSITPSGTEGLMDIHVIEALKKSSQERKTISIPNNQYLQRRPNAKMVITKPGIKKPKLVNAQPASSS